MAAWFSTTLKDADEDENTGASLILLTLIVIS
jgi:hypothetical protein